MWPYIKKENVQKFVDKYPQLSEFISELILLETQDSYFFPRHMYYTYPSEVFEYRLSSNTSQPAEINVTFNGNLRTIQEEAYQAIKEQYNKNGYVNGILKLPPGQGKTVLAAYCISQLGLKTCILLDNSHLLDQWKDELVKFTDLEEDDIGIIRQKELEPNKPVQIAMSQTLVSKIKNNFESAFKLVDSMDFGLVIYDEVHTTSSSERFSQVSLLFRTNNILGLSATPFQSGAAEILMKNTIGDIIYESFEYDMIPIYYFVKYESGLEKYKYPMQKIGDYIKQKGFYNSKIIQSQTYLDLISRFTKNLFHNDYCVMIVCMTKKQVQSVSQQLETDGITHRRYYGGEREIDYINDNILVVTYRFTGKGFNFKKLSALILACPIAGKKSLIQVAGRILRSNPGKKQPVIIDMIDMSFPGFFNHEMKNKKRIISNEFKNCKVFEYNMSGE